MLSPAVLLVLKAIVQCAERSFVCWMWHQGEAGRCSISEHVLAFLSVSARREPSSMAAGEAALQQDLAADSPHMLLTNDSSRTKTPLCTLLMHWAPLRHVQHPLLILLFPEPFCWSRGPTCQGWWSLLGGHSIIIAKWKQCCCCLFKIPEMTGPACLVIRIIALCGLLFAEQSVRLYYGVTCR